jgi:alpha-galactosidase
MTAASFLAGPARADTAPPPFPSTPVMGYNTWYQFRDTYLTEAAVLKQAQLLVSTGLAAAGYNTVNLDDGWMASKRTANGEGTLTWNTAKFPDGIPYLAAQLHAMGLHLGIYTAIGTRTCRGYLGSWSRYTQDSKAFASWGVDFVKVDQCGGLPSWMTFPLLTGEYQSFNTALKAAGIKVYSEELPVYAFNTPNFISAVSASSKFSNMWRVAPDENISQSASSTILGHLAADWHLHAFAGPGHWNDLDMVLVGNQKAMPFDWTDPQEESQLSVWAMEASPLLISSDLSTLSAREIADLTNPHMLAIDKAGQAATAVTVGHIEAVIKHDPEGGMAVLLVNLGSGTGSAKFTLAQLGISAATVHGFNVWAGTTTGAASAVATTLPAGGTVLYRFY